MHRIFKRVGLILKANIEGLLDKAEDPSAVAAQMVREIEEAVHKAKTAAAKTAADVKRLQRMHDRNVEQAHEWAQRATLALEKSRDDLAKEAVKREAQLRKSAEGLVPQIESLQARSSEMQSDVQALQSKLDEARMRVKQLSVRQRAVDSQQRVRDVQEKLGDGVSLSEFERLEQKMDDWEVEVDAYETVQVDSLEAQFKELEGDSPEIEERLAELRDAARDQDDEAEADEER